MAVVVIGSEGTSFFIIRCSVIVSRLAVMAATSITYLHTPEIFPTTLRGRAHTILNGLKMMSAMVAPFIIALLSLRNATLVMAILVWIAAAAVANLPETVGKSL